MTGSPIGTLLVNNGWKLRREGCPVQLMDLFVSSAPSGQPESATPPDPYCLGCMRAWTMNINFVGHCLCHIACVCGINTQLGHIAPFLP